MQPLSLIDDRPKWLAKASKTLKASWNVLCGVAPVFLSKQMVQHEKSRAEVHFVRSLMEAEAKAIGEVRADLWKRFIGASPVERISLKCQLEEIDEHMRHLAVSGKALDYLKEASQAAKSIPDALPDYWMDRFLKLSRSVNEPWRSELLSRALAFEASGQPISPRLLWTIGTLDHVTFEAFSYILDCSCIVWIENGTQTPIVPTYAHTLMDEYATDYPLNPNNRSYKFGSLIFNLQESGLIGEVFDNSMDLLKPYFYVKYGDETYRVSRKDKKTPTTLPGLMVSDLGRALAQFHSHTSREPGKKYFESALQVFRKAPFSACRVTKVKHG